MMHVARHVQHVAARHDGNPPGYVCRYNALSSSTPMVLVDLGPMLAELKAYCASAECYALANDTSW